MHVLVTRPPDEIPLQIERLAERGHHGVPCPLLEIRTVEDAAVDLTGAQAVLLTSHAGARALAAVHPRRDIPVLAVGDSTAELARSLGYAPVDSAAGDWQALAALARRRFDPARGVLVHAAGNAAAGDLLPALHDAGFSVRRSVLYEARPASAFPPAGREALESGTLDAVLFFSPRTAATFVSLVEEADLNAPCRSLNALCLSPAVGDAARALAWKRVRAAVRPDQEALLALLDGDD